MQESELRSLTLVLEDTTDDDDGDDESDKSKSGSKTSMGGKKPETEKCKSNNMSITEERSDSPDFHGFESFAEEAEYIKSLEGFRRDV